MTFDVRLRTYLVQQNLSVGPRIYPEIVPTAPTYPLLVINQPGAVPVQHRDRGSLRLITKVIKSYSDTANGAWAVAIELRAAIAGFQGFVTNEASAYETESKRYLVVTVAQFWSQE